MAPVGFGPAFAGSYGAAGSAFAKAMEGRPALARSCGAAAPALPRIAA